MTANKEIKTIGVLTSGGDAPGMNAAIRAVVRRGLSRGINMKGIKKGYSGLINEEIIDMTAVNVSDTIQRGGTILQTARCAEMRTPEGQQTAANVCKKHGIDAVSYTHLAQVTRIGAFLDWGLEKDLFLPYKEQTKKVHEGEEILVALYVDKSSRLCATMKVYHYLQTDSPYAQGDAVTGLVYEISDNFGVFLAVDEKYSGLIPKQEAQGNYKPGDEITLSLIHI